MMNPQASEFGTIGRRARIPLYPFLVSSFPMLFLMAGNLFELPLDEIARPFLLLQAVVLLAILVIGLLLDDFDRAGLWVTGAAILFFSYGHLYASLETVFVGGLQIGRHRYLVPAFGGLLALWTYLCLIRLRPGARSRQIGLAIALVLLASPSFTIAKGVLASSTAWQLPTEPAASTQSADLEQGQQLRDIYYIVLDAYARSDVLKAEYGFDNEDFMSNLEDRGFYVAEGSHANHMWTALSIGSSLNMEYIFDLGIPLTPGSYPGVLVLPVRESRVRAFLEARGYRTVAFRTSYLPTELYDADIFYDPTHASPASFDQPIRLSRFENMLLYSSAGLILLDQFGDQLHNAGGFRTHQQFDDMREIVLNPFEKIDEVIQLEGPKFVFIHIVSPHGPYLFDAAGNVLPQEGEFTLLENPLDESPARSVQYRDQAIFITNQIDRMLASIVEGSEPDPIVILQSDHGPGIGSGWNAVNGESLWQRTAILNAYLLPPECADLLYPNISPVNSFRLILGCEYGADIELVDDRVFFSPDPRGGAFTFVDVTETVSNK